MVVVKLIVTLVTSVIVVKLVGYFGGCGEVCIFSTNNFSSYLSGGGSSGDGSNFRLVINSCGGSGGNGLLSYNMSCN